MLDLSLQNGCEHLMHDKCLGKTNVHVWRRSINAGVYALLSEENLVWKREIPGFNHPSIVSSGIVALSLFPFLAFGMIRYEIIFTHL